MCQGLVWKHCTPTLNAVLLTTLLWYCAAQGFSLRTVKFLVMDEADRMLSMDFEESLDKILQVCGSVHGCSPQCLCACVCDCVGLCL